ncbi:MAG: ABC transporter substrate-binding protein, partial [Gammaproteobacteria bacterium]|nr:ABC transporter substrate-binding protein [Gammaproteobacteria bacterium]
MKRQAGFRLIYILLPALLLLFSTLSGAEKTERIVSLDLCTDWMLLKYASQSQRITYSPLLYRYQVDWVPDNLPVHDGSLEQVLELNPDLIM